MNWYKVLKCAQSEWFEQLRSETEEKSKARGSVIKTERKTEPYTLELYRGFNTDLTNLEREGDSYILSPENSEQGMMWFTHQFIGHYNPLEYAKSHGDLLLTYPLQCIKHWDEITYENGDVDQRFPEDVDSQSDFTQNNRFHCLYRAYCLELPEGWYWTYKTEKFIGTTNKITVSPDMVSKS